MKPITVVGSYNTGLSITVKRLPRAGETVAGWGYSEGPGGKGSNQAIAAKRLGGRVNFLGCVGDDSYGDRAVELWKREGVAIEFVKRSGTHTGLGFVVVDEEGANAITIDPGANLDLNPLDVSRAEGVIAQSAVLLVQLETTLEVVTAASKIAKANGVTVVLNPAPARKAEELDLDDVAILTPNENELREMTGTADVAEAARSLLRRGPSAVVVTLGERGAHVVTAEGGYSVPAPTVRVVDTTGAGDAFNGALAVALSEGEPLMRAVDFANYAGAMTVTKREVVPALPTRGQLDEFRRSGVLE